MRNNILSMTSSIVNESIRNPKIALLSTKEVNGTMMISLNMFVDTRLHKVDIYVYESDTEGLSMISYIPDKNSDVKHVLHMFHKIDMDEYETFIPLAFTDIMVGIEIMSYNGDI